MMRDLIRPRRARIALLPFGLVALAALVVFALMQIDWAAGARVNAALRGLPPSLSHPFGTDMLGRDLFARSLQALALSVRIGLLAAVISAFCAIVLAMAAAFHPAVDRLVQLLTELVLGLPHLVLVIFVAYAAGGGAQGVVLGVALTHWPKLARVLRHEVQAVAASDYVMVSRLLGRGRIWISLHHLVPHLMPFVVAGVALIFPHAILHEAALSFLGLGLEPHLPSIGAMLSEALRAIMAGQWWTAVFPGLGLLIVALGVEICGERLARKSRSLSTIEEHVK